jgi:hypothetical protein
MLILLPMHASATAVFKAERAQRCLPIRRLNISPQTNCNALAYVHVNINGNQMQRRETRGACRGLASILDARVALRSLLGIILIHTHTHTHTHSHTAGGRKRINFGFPSARTNQRNQRPRASEWGAFATFALPPACSFYILFTFRPRPSRSGALCVCIENR